MVLRLLALGALCFLASGALAADVPDGTATVPAPLVLMEGTGRRIAFVAEKATQRFFVYEWRDGRARLVETLPCTTGKADGDKQVEGDLKTPEGAYRFLRYIDGSQLPPLYGAGAFVMDYPNPFDSLARKTGGGIWMHGVETDARVHVARDTRGCVALSNPDVKRLRPWIRMQDTPIVVVERLAGATPETIASQAEAARAFIEGWRREWESKDLDAWLRRYDPAFYADGRDLRAWERRKRELAREEGERRIGVDELTVLHEKDRWWMTFRQEYVTAGHRDVGRKTLFVRGAEPSAWRIVSEQWSGLEGAFRVVDPSEIPPRLSPALVAAIAPDAAPAAAVASAPPKPQPQPPSVPEPAPAPTPEPPATQVVAAAEPPPVAAPAAAEPAGPAPAPSDVVAAPVRVRLSARLEAPRANRRTFMLLGPHVRREGESLVVQVQLLNLRPDTVHSGALVLSLPQREGAPAEPPRAEPFAVKQGKLIELSLPDADLPLHIGVLVRDEWGKVALDQDLVLETLP